MSNQLNLGTVGVKGGIALAGYSTPASTQSVIYAGANTNHIGLGTPVLIRNVTGGKTFYLTSLEFYQANAGTVPQSVKLYDDTTQVFEAVHQVERTVANNAFAFSYVKVTFPHAIPFSTSVKIDNTAAMGTVYKVNIRGWEE